MAQKKYVSLSKLSTFLDNLKNKFAVISHKHTISDITDYKVDTTLSSTSTNPVQNKVLDAEFEAISTAMNALDSAIDGKADSSHTHNDIYYTESEINTKFDQVNDAIAELEPLVGTTAEITPTQVANALVEGRTVMIVHTDSNFGTLLFNYFVGTDAFNEVMTSGIVYFNGDYIVGELIGNCSNNTWSFQTTTVAEKEEVSAALEGKADANHNHDSKYDVKGAAAAVQTNLDTVSDELDDHTGDTNIHVTTSNKTNWNTAYTHSQSAHARTDATKVADSTTNGNILINGTETNVYSHPNSGVTAGTYKSVTVNAQGHITAGTNPTTLAGYGITDAESKGAASTALADAKEYTDTVASGKSDTSHNHDTAYDAKGSASSALASAKTYADSAATTAANAVKNDLLSGAGTAYDTLKELGDLIGDNADAIDALETVAAGKADKTHSHAIADVSGLQAALDGKAASSHGTHVSYSTTAPVMDGTASVGTASTVARSDHKHPTDTSRASKTEFDTHTSNTTAHITSTERSNWNAAKTHADSAHAPSNAEKNQNAFSNVKIGSTTVAADTATDTLELVGSNVTIIPDATNDSVTFTVADGSTSGKGIVQLTNSTSSTSTTTAATPSSVKSAYDLANTAKTNAATAQTKADSAYTLAESKVDSLSDLGITATATELNYVDGVTSNVQTQLDTLSGTCDEVFAACTNLSSSLYTNINNLQTQIDKKAASGHTHDDRYYTETEIDSKLSGKANTSHGNHVPTTQTASNKVFLRNDNTWATVTPANIGAAASSHTHTVANITDLTATATELNYTDGVTSNIQTQLDAKPDTSDLGFVRILSCSSSDGVAYTGTADGVTALKSGLTIVFISSKTSASKTPTLNLNSLGAKSIKRRLSHLSTTTQEGYSTTWLYANKPYLLMYDGTQWIVDGLTKPSAADLYGTPAAATKATQDGNGNVIVDTYATKASIPTAATIADSVVDLLKDRGDTIVGAVNSNNDITLVSGLADGIYTLKYENSDGTTTSLGYFNMSSGNGNVTSYRNWFDVSTATLNQRWSNTNYAYVTSNGTGCVVTDYIPVTLSTDTANPTIMRFRGATFTGEASVIFYNSSKTVKASSTAGTDGVGMTVATTSVTTDTNGDYQISLGYRSGNLDTAWASGVAYMRVCLKVGSSALTTSSVQNVIITVNEPIDN